MVVDVASTMQYNLTSINFYIVYLLEMNNYKNPLVFDCDLKPYDQYIEELKAWCLATDLPKQKQGVAIALSLPESDVSDIRDKVFNEITLTNLSAENGVKC